LFDGKLLGTPSGEQVSKIRGVRFSKEEEKCISEFLNKNPLIDFSTLAKIAILNFIKHPEIRLTPVVPPARKEPESGRIYKSKR
jgi:hypothetical protein